MSRHSLALPLGVIAAMLVLMSLLPIWSSPDSRAAPLLVCENGDAAYPACATQTAAATAVTATTATVATTVTAATAASTATTNTTSTGVPTTATALQQITLTPQPSQTRGPTAVQPTATPVNGALTCIPGSIVEIKGRGPRSAPLLLYFNGRAVGGGVSDTSGNYRLALNVGPERAAFYPVQVRVRGTQQLVRETTCLVPYFTPTPTRRPRVPL